MNQLKKMVREFCQIDAPSGREDALRQKLISVIGSNADCRVDKLGNLICEKRGQNRAIRKIMLDAHMDEVGIIVTSISENGRLKFAAVGGIEASALLGRRVRISGVPGVIECIPVHLLEKDAANKIPDIAQMYIDIGSFSKEETLSLISPGDMGVFDSDFVEFGDGMIKGKALDDRIGCAILADMILKEQPYDLTFTFTVQEEVGLIGAKAAAFGVKPDSAIVVETTTAADIAGSTEENAVCRLGQGAVVSFMDRATLYNKKYYDHALEIASQMGVQAQPKQAVAGGNNAGAIHSSNEGIATLALSVPCRYLHSAVCVVKEADIYSTARLVQEMAVRMAGGEIKPF